MVSWLRKYQAKAVLAALFFRHLAKRAIFFWRRDPHALKRFFGYYQGDAIFPVTPDERRRFPSYQRCQVCSLCTFSCAAILEGKAPAGFEPKYLMLSSGRSSHESEYFSENWLPCYECNACSVECPNEVPIHAMANEIIERRKRVAFRA